MIYGTATPCFVQWIFLWQKGLHLVPWLLRYLFDVDGVVAHEDLVPSCPTLAESSSSMSLYSLCTLAKSLPFWKIRKERPKQGFWLDKVPSIQTNLRKDRRLSSGKGMNVYQSAFFVVNPAFNSRRQENYETTSLSTRKRNFPPR